MIKRILDFVLPPECHLCGEVLLENEEFLCGRCEGLLPRTFFHLHADNATTMKLAGHFPFVRATSHFFYTHEGSVGKLIQQFKYHNYPSLAAKLGEIMGRELDSAGYLSDIDYLIPLPIHWSKRLQRGYNQTEYIAKGVSCSTGIAFRTDLIATRAHKSQTTHSQEERKKLTSDLFLLKHPERYAGKHLLLIDDVCTTGATITAAARAILRDSPSSRISIATLTAAT